MPRATSSWGTLNRVSTTFTEEGTQFYQIIKKPCSLQIIKVSTEGFSWGEQLCVYMFAGTLSKFLILILISITRGVMWTEIDWIYLIIGQDYRCKHEAKLISKCNYSKDQILELCSGVYPLKSLIYAYIELIEIFSAELPQNHAIVPANLQSVVLRIYGWQSYQSY